MSCKYCDIKMRPLDDDDDDDVKVLKGESWKDEPGYEGGYIGQSHDDKFRMVVYYDAGCANTEVSDVKFCPFCGAELTMPAEPLIKDEKIRKAVRAWADAVGGSPVCFYEDTGYEGVGRLKIYREGYPAVFDLGHQFYDLELDTQYTIAELCGEEEE